ncbi:hypothetical protein [Stieleria varia]|uniref:Nickel uptake substrate-specific transmembrane region n=1 Tax=Stieleria varia TaxID=2528005 RepID=A0A5C6AX99_9BACT|nr:hypothetical protein [Stieleria varia]TWU04258.1 Nickel uptake substrate-specific transmembrane region [Stieleria varia]
MNHFELLSVLFRQALGISLGIVCCLSAWGGPPTNGLTLRAKIQLSDGSPAPHAVVHSHDLDRQSTITEMADAEGVVELTDEFLSGVLLHVASKDHRHQTVFRESAGNARLRLSKPLLITLQPSLQRSVSVTHDGDPAANVAVAVTGMGFEIVGETDANGMFVADYPSNDKLISVVAIHDELGVAGVAGAAAMEDAQTSLALIPTETHAVRVLDWDGNPVPGVTVAANAYLSMGYRISSKTMQQTRATTDQDGVAKLTWFPKEEPYYVFVELLSDGWKQDLVDRSRTDEGLTTLWVRRMFSVAGRVALPDSVDGRGMLVTGNGYASPKYESCVVNTRITNDGSFNLLVPSRHGFALLVSDLEWTSDVFSKPILAANDAEQSPLTLHAVPATPVEIECTLGVDRAPVMECKFNLSSDVEVTWIDPSGQEKTRNGQVRYSVWPSEDGIARLGIRQAAVNVQLRSDLWSETKILAVESTDSQRVVFHRDRLGMVHFVARPVTEDGPFELSTDVKSYGWSLEAGDLHAFIKQLPVTDGAMNVSCDVSQLSTLVVDRKNGRSGFATVDRHIQNVDLPMESNASLTGQIIDQDSGKPLSNVFVSLALSYGLPVGWTVQTDEEGRFQLDFIPPEIPLRLVIENSSKTDVTGVSPAVRVFEPGEEIENEVFEVRLRHALEPDWQDWKLIALDRARGKAKHLGIPAIIFVAAGDAELALGREIRKRFTMDPVPRFSPVLMTADEMLAEADRWAALDWPQPRPGELLMFVTTDSATVSDKITLDVAKAEVTRGVDFIQENVPYQNDGRRKLERARIMAKAKKQNIWLLTGNTLSNSVYDLAMWVNRHRDVLEKDLVIVTLIDGLDDHAAEIRLELGSQRTIGAFHAMLSLDLGVIVSSDGPLRNAGLPKSPQGREYFRMMLKKVQNRMTNEEVDALMESL